MTPTEISAAYAALHERWPELMTPYGIDYHNGIWWDIEEPVEDLVELHEELAHAACFMACLKACADRDFDVNFRPEWGGPKFYKISGGIVVDIAHPNTITEVMDRVMQLPKVNA